MDVYRCIAQETMLENKKLNDFNIRSWKIFKLRFFWCAVRVGITTRRGWLIVGGDETNRFLREVCTSIRNLDYHQVFACCSNWISLVSIYHSTIFAGPLSFGFPHPFGVPAEVRTGTIERWRKICQELLQRYAQKFFGDFSFKMNWAPSWTSQYMLDIFSRTNGQAQGCSIFFGGVYLEDHPS